MPLEEDRIAACSDDTKSGGRKCTNTMIDWNEIPIIVDLRKDSHVLRGPSGGVRWLVYASRLKHAGMCVRQDPSVSQGTPSVRAPFKLVRLGRYGAEITSCRSPSNTLCLIDHSNDVLQDSDKYSPSSGSSGRCFKSRSADLKLTYVFRSYSSSALRLPDQTLHECSSSDVWWQTRNSEQRATARTT